MADVALPSNAPVRRVVSGMIVAARNLAPVATTGGQSVAVCELPVGAVVIAANFDADATLALCDIGIEGPDIVDDPNFFANQISHLANVLFEGDLRMGYKVETEGEVVTITTANAIDIADTGRAWVVYSMNADIV